MPSTCPRCGAPRAATKRFCRFCGLDWRAPWVEETERPAQPVEASPIVAVSGTDPIVALVSAIVAVALIYGAIAFLQGGGDQPTRDVAADLGDEPTPTPSPTPTPRPTATPRPTPTAQQTPQPSPDPDERAFKAFVEHVTPVSAAIVAGMDNVSGDASRVDIEALQTSSMSLWLVLGEEATWVAANPPERCFRVLHSTYADAITTLHDALDLISDGAIERDPDLLDQGSETMSTGNRLFEDATKLIRRSNRACRS